MKQRAGVQVVFQDPYASFNPRHPVRRLIAEPLYLIENAPEGAEREARIVRALEEVGLEASDADKYIHEFSGGQRQRIGIARALYTDPVILVLDEATSALDAETEHEVISALEHIKGVKTVFIIAHRLSTIHRCDQLIFLKEGRVQEIGAFEEIKSKNAEFLRMIQLSELSGNPINGTKISKTPPLLDPLL